MSDLHLEYLPGRGKEFVEQLPVEGDVLILAGDICNYQDVKMSMQWFSDKWDSTVYIAGNHDHFGTGFSNMKTLCQEINLAHTNVHWLENSSWDIPNTDKKIHGATLWYPDNPMAFRKIIDFRLINEFVPHVYAKHAETIKYFRDYVKEGDIVVTHQTPSYKSVTDKWKNDPMNCWFHNNLDGLIHDIKPSHWIHGHTHESLYYKIASSQIICNPKGYEMLNEGKDFLPTLTIEV